MQVQLTVTRAIQEDKDTRGWLWGGQMRVLLTQPFAQASLTPAGAAGQTHQKKSNPLHPGLFWPNVPQIHKNIPLQKSHTAGGAMLHQLHFPPRGGEVICGLAAPPASLSAQPVPNPIVEPGLKSALSMPKEHLKPPPS